MDNSFSCLSLGLNPDRDILLQSHGQNTLNVKFTSQKFKGEKEFLVQIKQTCSVKYLSYLYCASSHEFGI